jgi:hypothetical protein
VGCFELLRTNSAKVAVTTRRTVERLDVGVDVGVCQRPVFVDLFLDALLCQAAEEGLGNSIIPAVTFAAHAGLEAIRPAESAPSIAAELSALIGMNHGVARHQHRIEHEFTPDRRCRRPTHHFAREQVQ